MPSGLSSLMAGRTWGCDGSPGTSHQRAVGLIPQTSLFLELLHILVSANPILPLSLRVFIRKWGNIRMHWFLPLIKCGNEVKGPFYPQEPGSKVVAPSDLVPEGGRRRVSVVSPTGGTGCPCPGGSS